MGSFDESAAGHEPLRPTGSGTLVRVGARSCILTAAHVWEDALKKYPEIVLFLRSGILRVPTYTIGTDLRYDPKNQGQGPDLALLTLPPPQAGSVLAQKTAINVEKLASSKPLAFEGGTYAVVGLVEEFSEIDTNQVKLTVDAEIHMACLFMTPGKAWKTGEFDYLEVIADLQPEATPHSFGGMSGGGVWQLAISRESSGKVMWSGKEHFRGIAFAECFEGKDTIIRAHGYMSIFDSGLLGGEVSEQ